MARLDEPASPGETQECAQARICAALREWFAQPPGRWILEAETAQLGDLLANLFGYHLLLVDYPGCAEILERTRVRDRVVIAPPEPGGDGRVAPGHGYPVVRACADALPVASDSVDAVLLPHVLEFETNPHQALREAERVLVPEGSVVVTGFNPWSLMGLGRVLAGLRPGVPWSGRFFSLMRMRDWSSLLGLETVHTASCFYRPPLGNRNVMSRLAGLERLGARYWRGRGAVYVLMARKRVTTLTPIRPHWRPRRGLVAPGLVKPSSRQAAARVGWQRMNGEEH